MAFLIFSLRMSFEMNKNLPNKSSTSLTIRNCEENGTGLLSKIELERTPDDNIEVISFIDSSIEVFPTKFIVNKNLTKLEITRFNCLRKITQNDLKGLVNLTTLSITYTAIERLPSNLFIYTRNLRDISFNNNQIIFVGKHLLKPLDLTKMERFNLQSNRKFNLIFDVYFESKKDLVEFVSLESLQQAIAAFGVNDDHILKNENLTDLWQKKLFCDCKFTFADTKQILAHKCILGTQSYILASDFDNNVNCMKIDEIPYEAFEQFLKYLYLREIPEFNDDIFYVHAAAVKYKIEKLSDICEEIILSNINATNAIKILKHGCNQDNDFLKFCAFKFICDSFNKDLPAYFANYPEIVEKYIDAGIIMKKEIKEAEMKYEAICKMLMQKVQNAEEKEF